MYVSWSCIIPFNLSVYAASAGSDSVFCPPANASGTRGLDPGERVRHALRLLEAHPGSIDTVKALEMLPSSIPVRDVCLFLENVIKEKASSKRNAQVSEDKLEHCVSVSDSSYHRMTELC